MVGCVIVNLGMPVKGEPIASQLLQCQRTTLLSGRTAFEFDRRIYLSFQGTWYHLERLPNYLQGPDVGT